MRIFLKVLHHLYRNSSIKTGGHPLYDIQLQAADVLFHSDNNVIISSSTASGKSEAAFFPIITRLYNAPIQSIGALYISPLKALINDQYTRIGELLKESGIPVTHWHGDVSTSNKRKLLAQPRGILQITAGIT